MSLHDKFNQVLLLEEYVDKKLKPGITSILGASAYYTQEECFETAGDAGADGTSLLTITVTAGKVFIGLEFTGACNNVAVLRVGTGALGGMTDYDWIVVNTSVSGKISDGVAPMFLIDNSGSSSDLTLRVYVPKTAWGAATNNAATNYFYAKIGGLLI